MFLHDLIFHCIFMKKYIFFMKIILHSFHENDYTLYISFTLYSYASDVP